MMQLQNMHTDSELKHTMIQIAIENEYTQAIPNNITFWRLERKSKQINQT